MGTGTPGALQVQGAGTGWCKVGGVLGNHQPAFLSPSPHPGPRGWVGARVGRVDEKAGRRMCLQGSVFKTNPHVSEVIRTEARRRVGVGAGSVAGA